MRLTPLECLLPVVEVEHLGELQQMRLPLTARR